MVAVGKTLVNVLGTAVVTVVVTFSPNQSVYGLILE
jgi:hypothetical protein